MQFFDIMADRFLTMTGFDWHGKSGKKERTTVNYKLSTKNFFPIYAPAAVGEGASSGLGSAKGVGAGVGGCAGAGDGLGNGGWAGKGAGAGKAGVPGVFPGYPGSLKLLPAPLAEAPVDCFTVKLAAEFAGLTVGWKGTEPLALTLVLAEVLEVVLPEVELPDVELPEAGWALPEFAFPALALPPLAFPALELPLFELLEFELLELELLALALLVLPALTLGVRLVEPLALALVFPEFALGVKLVEPPALALESPAFTLGVRLVEPLAGALAGTDAAAAAVDVGFCAKAVRVPKMTKAVRR